MYTLTINYNQDILLSEMATPLAALVPPATRVADEVWIATALLHRENPDREAYTIDEIVDRARQEKVHSKLRAGVRVHAALHCVANREPNPARLRMLYATGKNTRRLWRPGDPAHALRKGKSIPDRREIPAKYHKLLDWYASDYVRRASSNSGWLAGVLSLQGAGREIWAGQDPDEYVRMLREGWD